MAARNSGQQRLEWDELFMGIAILASQRSPDKKMKVGACLVGEEGSERTDLSELTPKKRVMGIGYNESPYGTEWPENDEKKEEAVIHAEQKAMIHSNGSTMGATMYVTLHPCYQCAKMIVQSGIKRVIYLQRKDGQEEFFGIKEDARKIPIARKILKENGVDIKAFHKLESVKKDKNGNAAELSFDYEQIPSLEAKQKDLKFKLNFINWNYREQKRLGDEPDPK